MRLWRKKNIGDFVYIAILCTKNEMKMEIEKKKRARCFFVDKQDVKI